MADLRKLLAGLQRSTAVVGAGAGMDAGTSAPRALDKPSIDRQVELPEQASTRETPTGNTLAGWNSIIQTGRASDAVTREVYLAGEDCWEEERIPAQTDEASEETASLSDTGDASEEPEQPWQDLREQISLAGAGLPSEAEWLEPTAVVCSKTGRLLGTADSMLEPSTLTADPEAALYAIASPCRGVTPTWRDTGPEALERLAIDDMEGLTVYLCSKLALYTRRLQVKHTPQTAVQVQTLPSVTASASDPASLWCMARAFQWAWACPTAELQALMDPLLRLTALGPSGARALQRLCRRQQTKRGRSTLSREVLPEHTQSADWLCRHAALGHLTALVHAAYSDAIASAITGAAAASLGRANDNRRDAQTPWAKAQKGPSNVRRVKRVAKGLDVAQEFAGFFADLAAKDLGLTDTTASEAAQAKTESRKQAQASATDAFLQAFSNSRVDYAHVVASPEPLKVDTSRFATPAQYASQQMRSQVITDFKSLFDDLEDPDVDRLLSGEAEPEADAEAEDADDLPDIAPFAIDLTDADFI